MLTIVVSLIRRRILYLVGCVYHQQTFDASVPTVDSEDDLVSTFALYVERLIYWQTRQHFFRCGEFASFV